MKRCWNAKMHSSSFNDRSFGNDCRMMHFLVLASFRGQTRKDEGGRDEKSGMVFYGANITYCKGCIFWILHIICFIECFVHPRVLLHWTLTHFPCVSSISPELDISLSQRLHFSSHTETSNYLRALSGLLKAFVPTQVGLHLQCVSSISPEWKNLLSQRLHFSSREDFK